MIFINHQKKIIFIHVPKTGGTYVGEILEKYYHFTSYYHIMSHGRPDHDDVCANIVSHSLFKRRRFFNKTMGIIEYCKTSDWLNEQMNMTPQKWDEYYKFTIVRNPIHRFISGVKDMKRRKIMANKLWKLPNLEIYLANHGKDINDVEYAHIFMSQTKHLSDENNNLCVNGLIQTEHLEQGLQSILRFFGFPVIHAPQTTVNAAKDHEQPLWLSPETLKILHELFHTDYKFTPMKFQHLSKNP
jgi:hypothetical protein